LKETREKLSALGQRLLEVIEERKREAAAAASALRRAEEAREAGAREARAELVVLLGRTPGEAAALKGKRRWAENRAMRIALAGPVVEGLKGYWALFEARNASGRPRVVRDARRAAAQGGAPPCVIAPLTLRKGEKRLFGVYCEGAERPRALEFTGDDFALVMPLPAASEREVADHGRN